MAQFRDRPMYWKLDKQRRPIPGNGIREKISDPERYRVGGDIVCGLWVSTVFLCVDYSHDLDGPPVLWETMVFQDDDTYEDIDLELCSGSWDQAEEMHRRMCERVREALRESVPEEAENGED